MNRHLIRSLKKLVPPFFLKQLRRLLYGRFFAQWPFIHRLRLLKTPRQEVFSRAYNGPVWGSNESFSGTGSTLEATENIRRELPNLIRTYNIRTMLDAPCGDWNWMSQTETTLDQYFGVDIVSSVIADNTKKYGKDNIKFMCRNIVSDELPSVDLIMCRDCLVHLSYQDIKSVIENFKETNSTYLFTNTYPDVDINDNIFTGLKWRPLNMQREPFNFPEPILLFADCVSLNDGSFMALWRIKDIPLINI